MHILDETCLQVPTNAQVHRKVRFRDAGAACRVSVPELVCRWVSALRHVGRAAGLVEFHIRPPECRDFLLCVMSEHCGAWVYATRLVPCVRLF